MLQVCCSVWVSGLKIFSAILSHDYFPKRKKAEKFSEKIRKNSEMLATYILWALCTDHVVTRSHDIFDGVQKRKNDKKNQKNSVITQ